MQCSPYKPLAGVAVLARLPASHWLFSGKGDGIKYTEYSYRPAPGQVGAYSQSPIRDR